MSVNFEDLKKIITEIYENVKINNEGKVADYIPELSKVNPDLFGISVCTVNGEQFDIGDTDINFSMQSCSKPLLYCIAQDLLGDKEIHEHVGYEPSGRAFNAFVLNQDGKPHNPMINAGAIAVSSYILPNNEPADRFNHVTKFAKRMAGNSQNLGFDNSVYLSEKRHAHRNFALSHFMAENSIFPPGTDIKGNLEFYFQACSILTNTKTMSIIASTLANSGRCPITDEQVISATISKNCLSLMYMCGMYDFSGRFAFEIGLPAKSGVSGCLMLIVPHIMGICIWSPPLDRCGNTVRGIEVCRGLVSKFTFHIFDKLVEYCPGCEYEDEDGNINDTKSEDDEVYNLAYHFIMASSKGKIDKVKYFVEEKHVNVNVTDYDKRTALHVAAADGHVEVVKYLLDNEASVDLKDRWGNTPYHEAHKNISNGQNYKDICDILKE